MDLRVLKMALIEIIGWRMHRFTKRDFKRFDELFKELNLKEV